MEMPPEEELIDALVRWGIKGTTEEYEVSREQVMSWIRAIAKSRCEAEATELHPWNQWQTPARLGRILGVSGGTVGRRGSSRAVHWPQFEQRTVGNTYEYRVAPGTDPYVSVEDEEDLVGLKKMLTQSTEHRAKLQAENDDLRAQLFEANRIIELVRLGADHAPVKTSPRDRQLLELIEHLDRRLQKLEGEKKSEEEVVLDHEGTEQESEQRAWNRTH